MSKFNRILCPVDLSENSSKAVELATTVATAKNAKIVFLYVAPQWLPQESSLGSEYVEQETLDERRQFENIKPCENVPYEHVFRHGNAGPEIVKESRRCDMVVMSTHGYGGILRFLMGSVAQYTMRNVDCPCVMVKVHEPKQAHGSRQCLQHFATDIMRQVAPVQEHDNMEHVISELDEANESAAPVTDCDGTVIGILTATDISRYNSLMERFRAKDESVVKEIFEVDQYGHVRVGYKDFNQVKRHMSSPVVTILNTESIERANQMFEADQGIHHLIVVDENDRPLGILQSEDCRKAKDKKQPPIDVSIHPISN